MILTFLGIQSGFGLTEDLDLYNVLPCGTTVAVPAGAPPSVVAEHAAAVLAKWKEAQ